VDGASGGEDEDLDGERRDRQRGPALDARATDAIEVVRREIDHTGLDDRRLDGVSFRMTSSGA
jgi:hypothetical protein